MVRVVVTGVTADGKSVFVNDGEAPVRAINAMPDSAVVDVWGSDQPLRLPDRGTRPDYRNFFPPIRGFRVMMLQSPPDGEGQHVEVDPIALRQELEQNFPGWLADSHPDPDDPRFHRTDTVDVGVVLEGQVTLELDDGAARTLEPGDIYVQNGTRHKWSNRGTVPSRMCVFLLGVERSSSTS